MVSRLHLVRLCLVALMVALAANGDVAADDPTSLPPGALVRCGTTRLRLGSLARSTAFLPDGKHLLIGAADGTLRVWDLTTGKESRQLRLGTQVQQLRVSPDGKAAATSAYDGFIRIWDLTTGESKARIQFQNADPNAFCWVGNSRVAASSYDGNIHVLDTSGAEVASWRSGLRNSRPSAMVGSADGKSLFAASYDGQILCWNPETGEDRIKLEQVGDGRSIFYGTTQQPLVLSSDGKLITMASSRSPMVTWDTATGKMVHRFDLPQSGATYSAAFSPNGRFLAAATSDGYVRIWGLLSSRELRILDSDRTPVGMLMFSADGKALYGLANNQLLRAWSLATGDNLLGNDGHRLPVSQMRFLSDGRLVTSSQDGMVRCWDPATGKTTAHLSAQGQLYLGMARDSDDNAVVLITGTGEVKSWTPGKEPVQRHPGENLGSNSMAVSPDSRFAMISNPQGLHLLNIGQGKLIRSFQVGPNYYGPMAVSANARYVAHVETNNYGTLRVWESAGGKLVLERKGTPGQSMQASKLQFTPDGRCLALLNNSGLLQMLEVATGLVRGTMTFAGESTVAQVAFSPDGQILILGTNSGRIRLLDFATGVPFESLVAHNGAIQTLATSDDGKRLASGGVDTTVVIWDLAHLRSTHLASTPGPRNEHLGGYWNDLGSRDGIRAHAALWRLACADPEQVVPLIRERQKPAAPPSAADLDQWIRNLGADRYSVRVAAERALADVGIAAKPALEAAIKKPMSAEGLRRAEQLLETLKEDLPLPRLRALRSVELLERIGTPAARSLLAEIGKASTDEIVKKEVAATLPTP